MHSIRSSTSWTWLIRNLINSRKMYTSWDSSHYSWGRWSKLKPYSSGQQRQLCHCLSAIAHGSSRKTLMKTVALKMTKCRRVHSEATIKNCSLRKSVLMETSKVKIWSLVKKKIFWSIWKKITKSQITSKFRSRL